MNYIDKLNDHLHNDYTKKLYEFGINNNYPIMELNGIANLMFIIKQNNVKRILEIGCDAGNNRVPAPPANTIPFIKPPVTN